MYSMNSFRSSDLIMPMAFPNFVRTIRESPGEIESSDRTSLGMTTCHFAQTTTLPYILNSHRGSELHSPMDGIDWNKSMKSIPNQTSSASKNAFRLAILPRGIYLGGKESFGTKHTTMNHLAPLLSYLVIAFLLTFVLIPPYLKLLWKYKL